MSATSVLSPLCGFLIHLPGSVSSAYRHCGGREECLWLGRAISCLQFLPVYSLIGKNAIVMVACIGPERLLSLQASIFGVFKQVRFPKSYSNFNFKPLNLEILFCLLHVDRAVSSFSILLAYFI